MDAIEGPGVGETRDFGNRQRGEGRQGRQEFQHATDQKTGEPQDARGQELARGQEPECQEDLADGLSAVLEIVRRESEPGAGWGNDFDGIRSEVDFRRAMAREEERLRGSWGQRLTRVFGAMGMSFWNSRPLRLLR